MTQLHDHETLNRLLGHDLLDQLEALEDALTAGPTADLGAPRRLADLERDIARALLERRRDVMRDAPEEIVG